MAKVVVHNKEADNAVLAQGETGEDVIKLEGSYYFSPKAVNMEMLQVSERTYTCPYKGMCYWIDLRTEKGETVKEVAWVYRKPKEGYEQIKDYIAFYGGDSFATTVKFSR